MAVADCMAQQRGRWAGLAASVEGRRGVLTCRPGGRPWAPRLAEGREWRGQRFQQLPGVAQGGQLL